MTDKKSPEPLRTDPEGNGVYAEWDDSDEVLVGEVVDAELVPEWNGSTELAISPSSELVRQEVQTNWDHFRRKVIERHFDPEYLLEGVEKVYSTSQAAAFFGRSNQWMYWGLRSGIFLYKDGTPILPERIGKGGRRRFTLPLIREIALSCYRRGNVSEEELQTIMAKILLAEFGEKAFAITS